MYAIKSSYSANPIQISQGYHNHFSVELARVHKGMYAVFMLWFGIMPAMGEQMIPDMALSPSEAERWYSVWHETCLLTANQQNILKNLHGGGKAI